VKYSNPNTVLGIEQMNCQQNIHAKVYTTSPKKPSNPHSKFYLQMTRATNKSPEHNPFTAELGEFKNFMH
jgi:hypothetical protein